MNLMIKSIEEMYKNGGFVFITENNKVEIKINKKDGLVVKFYHNKEDIDNYEIFSSDKMVQLYLSGLVMKSVFVKDLKIDNHIESIKNTSASEKYKTGVNKLYNYYKYLLDDDRGLIKEIVMRDKPDDVIKAFVDKGYRYPDNGTQDYDLNFIYDDLIMKTNNFIRLLNCGQKIYDNLMESTFSDYKYAQKDWDDFLSGKNGFFEMNKDYIPSKNNEEINTSALEEEHISYEFIDEKEYIIDPAIGRDKEKRLVGATMATPSYSSIIIGEPGIGKTAIIEGLAYDIQNGLVSDYLKNKKIMKISPSNIVSDTRYTGVFEKKMQILLEFLKDNPDIILYMDEMHTAKGAGSHSKSDTDILDILKPYIENGSIKMIGATTLEEYDKYIKSDRAFSSRVKIVEVKELSLNILKEVIENNITKFEKMTDIEFCKNASEGEKIIDILIELTDIKHQVWHEKRYNPRFILSIIEMAFGFGVYDKKETLDIDSFIEAIEMESNLNESAKEKAISDLKNMKIKENNNKIIDFKKLVLK